eukprot:scaffold1457_cov350-Prasinococcus_capsulatus_cf.AAC.10
MEGARYGIQAGVAAAERSQRGEASCPHACKHTFEPLVTPPLSSACSAVSAASVAAAQVSYEAPSGIRASWSAGAATCQAHGRGSTSARAPHAPSRQPRHGLPSVATHSRRRVAAAK